MLSYAGYNWLYICSIVSVALKQANALFRVLMGRDGKREEFSLRITAWNEHILIIRAFQAKNIHVRESFVIFIIGNKLFNIF